PLGLRPRLALRRNSLSTRTVERREAFGVRPACRRFAIARDPCCPSKKREQAARTPNASRLPNSSRKRSIVGMDQHLPPSPASCRLKPVPVKALAGDAPAKDWPHAPVHRLSAHGIYFITAGTLHKQHLFDTPAKRDLLERMLLSLS